jgi:hypothetical protein
MSSSHGSDVAPDAPRGPAWGPGGVARILLRTHADALSTDLHNPHGELPLTDDGLPTWDSVGSDYGAFRIYTDFRYTLDYIEPHDETGEELWRAVDLFHAALPFSEGERRWFLDTYKAARSVELTKLGVRAQEVVAGTETTITSNGLHQVIKGRELMRRWAAWRRETAEFAGQGTVEEAQQHAKEISRLVMLGDS